MRVSKGILKGRIINVPKAVRPVSLSVKEACFNLLGEEVVGKNVLDLFAGSGALGIEALSNGAAAVTFIDSDKNNLMQVKKNLLGLGITSKTTCYVNDAFRAVKILFQKKKKFGCVFIDPPYYKSTAKKILQLLGECDILCPSGYIVCFCYENEEYLKDFSENAQFSLVVNKKYGQTRLLIYCNE